MCRRSWVRRSWLGRDDKWSAASVGFSYRVSECREVVRAQLLRDSTDGGGWRHFCSTCKRGEIVVSVVHGPSGVAHPSDSCAVVFIEIAADLEVQPITLSLVRLAAGREVQRNRRRLCAVSKSSSVARIFVVFKLIVLRARAPDVFGRRTSCVRSNWFCWLRFFFAS